MCVMDRVGVRELRQNLSVYLDRVKSGEALQVTEHGHPVAVLAPLPEPADPVARLLAAGRLRAASESWASLAPPPGPVSYAATDALRDDRAGKE